MLRGSREALAILTGKARAGDIEAATLNSERVIGGVQRDPSYKSTRP
jgi:hypothetical protein